MTTNLSSAFRCATLMICLSGHVLLTACGGGIAGSGNGGGSSNPDVPPGVEKYDIEFLPLEISPALPASVSQDTDNPDWFDNQNPAQTLAYSIANLIDNKVALGMMQLYIDSGWQEILDYCDLQQSAQCSLQNSGLSITYTYEMALWEIDLRKEVEQEKIGLSGTLSPQSIQAIEQQVIAKVGSQVQLNSVVFEKLENQRFDYLVTMKIDELMPLRCTLSWDNSKRIISTAVANEPGANTELSYEASYDRTSGRGEFELMQDESDRTIAIQVQINKIPDTDEFYLESALSQTTGQESIKIDSRGQINEQEAYLFSESSITTPTTADTVYHREVIGTDGPIAAATCNPQASTSDCTLETEWNTQFGNDPTTTELYLSNQQLDQYATQPDNIILNGVSEDLNAFLLLDGDQITPDLQNKILVLSIPGLGPIEWSLTEQADGRLYYLVPDYQTAVLLDLTLCTATRSSSGNQQALPASCNVPTEKLSNAVVVGESVTQDGEIKLFLETGAIVTPIE